MGPDVHPCPCCKSPMRVIYARHEFACDRCWFSLPKSIRDALLPPRSADQEARERALRRFVAAGPRPEEH